MGSDPMDTPASGRRGDGRGCPVVGHLRLHQGVISVTFLGFAEPFCRLLPTCSLRRDVVSYRRFLEGGFVPSNGKRGDKMATSSIFAKIELKDQERVRAFVDALCSDKPWPQPRPTVHADHLSSPDEIREFFATRRGVRIAAAT